MKTNEEIKALKEKMKRLAPKNLPPPEPVRFDDYGHCVPNCEICHGVGWLRDELPIDHPDFGKIKPCPNRLTVGWDLRLGISKDEAMELDWDDYLSTDAVKSMKGKMKSLLAKGYGMLYIHGDPGNGKTIMGKSMAVHGSALHGFRTRYRKHSDIINELRAAFDDDHGQRAYSSRLQVYQKVKLLVIDEVGRDRITEFSKTATSDIIDARYEGANLRSLITVFISNHKPQEIFEPYLYDRITDGRMEVLKVAGTSLRPGMETGQVNPNKYRMWWMEKDN